jgi:hypothetical protein
MPSHEVKLLFVFNDASRGAARFGLRDFLGKDLALAWRPLALS